uniref:Methyltransferase type 11 domain-containing protein n=1 Tax=Chenopodium quinoa TaxID=63459 RepID=A0A803L4R0_CHEQI
MVVGDVWFGLKKKLRKEERENGWSRDMVVGDVAEYYNQVIATDISEPQINRAIHHPRVKYIHTPTSLSNNDLISLIGPEGSVDLITVAQAVHWFDLPNFYSIVDRLLKKRGGIFAVWGYKDVTVSPAFDPIMKEFHNTTLPYWDPKLRYVLDGYKTLPFPFEDVGLGSEGRPMELDIPKMMSFEGYLVMLKSWSAVTTAKEKGVDLLNESVVNDLMTAWGGSHLVKPVVCKVAEYYNQVIATDISEPQINRAIQHPRVKYIHTPTSLSNNDLISLIGPEGSIDLITVAQAVHWFDLPNFYSIVNRLLRKPGGIFAVWCYNDVAVSPTFDPIMNRFHKTTLPYWDPKIQYVLDGYKTLPFPFEDVGLGSEGRPMELDIPKTMSFEGFLGMLKSWSAITTAKEKGVDLLNESVVND